jgi:hypothetical protein
MNGGKLYVPVGSERLFLNSLAVEIVRGNPWHVVERRTALFRLFFDVDAHVDAGNPRTDDEWISTLQALADAAREMFDVETDVVVARSPPKRVDGDTEKHGFHVHFPGIVVGAATANAVRRKVVDAATEAFPDFVKNGWSACVDAAVFNGSGLRLPWQLKGPNSPASAVYAPFLERRAADGEWSRVDAGAALGSVAAIRDYLTRCSLRCTPNEFAAHIRSGALDAGELEALDENDTSGAALGARFGARHASLYAYGDALPKLAECLPMEFRDQRFTAIMEADSVFILRSSSKFCLNVCRTHASSNVYFVLRPGGIYQRCYCRKMQLDGRDSGKLCRDFAGPMYPVPLEVTSAFFASKFLDDVPIVDHPDVGVEATKDIIAKQAVQAVMSDMRRSMPSAVIKRNLSVRGFLDRSLNAKRRKKAPQPAPKRSDA